MQGPDPQLAQTCVIELKHRLEILEATVCTMQSEKKEDWDQNEQLQKKVNELKVHNEQLEKRVNELGEMVSKQHWKIMKVEAKLSDYQVGMQCLHVKSFAIQLHAKMITKAEFDEKMVAFEGP